MWKCVIINAPTTFRRGEKRGEGRARERASSRCRRIRRAGSHARWRGPPTRRACPLLLPPCTALYRRVIWSMIRYLLDAHTQEKIEASGQCFCCCCRRPLSFHRACGSATPRPRPPLPLPLLALAPPSPSDAGPLATRWAAEDRQPPNARWPALHADPPPAPFSPLVALSVLLRRCWAPTTRQSCCASSSRST